MPVNLYVAWNKENKGRTTKPRTTGVTQNKTRAANKFVQAKTTRTSLIFCVFLSSFERWHGVTCRKDHVSNRPSFRNLPGNTRAIHRPMPDIMRSFVWDHGPHISGHLCRYALVCARSETKNPHPLSDRPQIRSAPCLPTATLIEDTARRAQLGLSALSSKRFSYLLLSTF